VRGLSGFDRLDSASDRPLAVAFSGGGDSLAVLLMAKAWADAHGRRVLALTVDHGLQAASAGWTDQCRATAARLGVWFEALSWTGEKPATGLPAAAREARHRLLADAARKAGARVLLMGHTADDLLEAGVMRGEGSTVGDPREWAPSPAWPEGRGVFILRPLLDQRRAALREWLMCQGETWIDDPANENPRSARARARLSLSAHPGEGRNPDSAGALRGFHLDPGLRRDERWNGVGVLALSRKLARAQIAAACLCAAGTAMPPRGERLARLAELVNGAEPFTATLAGARIEAIVDAVRFMRDAGESARGGLAPLDLIANELTVWDGRFEIVADRLGLTATALKGYASRLPAAERDALKAVPAAARPALPVVIDSSGAVSCPLLAGTSSVQVRSLVLERFCAAVGLIQREADL
jgi:tRNA(Ile)-lysidine synthase